MSGLLPHERLVIVFLLKHLAAGVVGAVVLGLGILAFDVANLRTLIWSSEDATVALIMLFGGLIATFGSVAMGAAIMSLGRGE